MPQGEYLLRKNHIHVAGQELNEEPLRNVIKQEPNRRILGVIPFYLGLYNWGKTGTKEKGVRAWLRRIGEPPVVYDSTLKNRTTEQLALYLFKQGYFNAKVTDSVEYKIRPSEKKIERGKTAKRKARVHYYIETGEPYTIRKKIYAIDDGDLMEPIRKATKNSKIKPGERYKEADLTQERERLESAMRNMGYYNFSREFVYFELDSSVENKGIDVKIIIKNPTRTQSLANGKDTTYQVPHELYEIKEIYVTTNGGGFNTPFSDTTTHKNIHILHNGPLEYRPRVLSRAIFIKPDTLFNQRDINYTYSRLQALRSFRRINISIEKNYSGNNKLDAFINLAPGKKRNLTIETEATNRQGNLGIQGNVRLRNKNTFRGAEILQTKILGGLEAQQISQIQEGNATQGIFNTVEYGAELGLFIPQLLVPKRFNTDPTFIDPKTNFTLSVNRREQPAFDRTLFNLGYSYQWKPDEAQRLSFTPLYMSYITIDKRPFFEQALQASNNPILINSYRSHSIQGSAFEYGYTNKTSNENRNYMWLETKIETAGNLLRGVYSQTGADLDASGSYRMFNVPFAQFLRPSIDIRSYQILSKNTKMVYRAFTGVGIALANLTSMPFEYSYFAGGANDIRAWVARQLGPGGVTDTLTSTDQIGDIKLEVNMEFRFPITKSLDGAMFIDAGNIFMLRDDPKRENEQIQFSRLHKDIAVGTGVGLRYDFSFFVIRLDMGFKLHDPILPNGERWFFQSKSTYNEYRAEYLSEQNRPIEEYRSNPTFHIAIGYPF